MIRLCFKLIGCFLLPLFPSPSQTSSLVSLPTLGRSALSNYGARLISAPPLFLLRRMEGGVRKKGWMRKRSEAKQRVKEKQEWEGRRVPGLRPMNRLLLFWPGFYAFLLYFFFAGRFLRRKSNKQQFKVTKNWFMGLHPGNKERKRWKTGLMTKGNKVFNGRKLTSK